MIRILLADDHAIVRAGLKRLLDEESDMEVIAEVGTGDEVVPEIGQHRVDVAVVDVSMPGPGLVRLLERIQTVDAPPRVLVLSIQPEDVYGVRALRAGAAGYLSKERSPEELAAAIRRIHQGHTYVSPDLAEKLALDLVPDTERPAHEQLSEREFQVLGLLGSGHTVTDIGERLYLSPKTVSTYRARLLEKLGLATTADLVRYAVQNHIEPT